MKFLCGNCKAKYQIADDKLVGRTLRMKCRRCSQDIVIRGDDSVVGDPTGAVGGARRPEATPRGASRRPGHAAVTGNTTRRANALGSEFRRQVTSAAPPDLPRAPAVEVWHVAINDVPVGPVHREEVARKIAVGAVTAESLVWREGFDDWRPLREVPELEPLLRQRKVPQATGAKPVPGRGISSRSSRTSRPPPAPTRPQTGSSAARRPEPTGAKPTPRSNVVPIGGRLGAATSPAIEELDLDEIEQTPDSLLPGGPTEVVASVVVDEFAAPSVAQARAASATRAGAEAGAPVVVAQPARRQLPVGAWIAMVGVGAFGIALATILGQYWLGGQGPQLARAPQEPVDTPVVQATGEPEPAPDLELPEPEPELEPEVEASPDSQEASRPRVASGSATASKTTRPSQASAEDDRFAMLAQGLDRNIGVAGARTDEDRTRAATAGEGLEAHQLSAVVNRHRPSLQRCYERAIRGAAAAEAVRLDVEITVQPSGRVSAVSVGGRAIADLKTCIEASVRQWVFPRAGASSATRFPLVLAPGS